MTTWGGRFSEPPGDVLWRYTVDHSDRRLLDDDLAGCIAHVEMLASVGILDEGEAGILLSGLREIEVEALSESFPWSGDDEDVHSAVERRLGELVGDVAGKLHAGRSRNDQVATDMRLYLRRAAAARSDDLRDLVGVLVVLAGDAGERIVPSYTHLQQAQAVPLAHHLLAYAWMLVRDRQRFADVAVRLGESPLGAGASGGSSLPLDTEETARRLGFTTVFENSLDAVGSRDLVSEYVFCCAQAMVHLSRLSEEMVLWATDEFGWVTYSDAHTTGSSALPQKKNPDIAELARGRSATVIGDVAAILALQKGLALSYSRDLQEDKRIAFHADDALAGSVEALGAMLATAEFDPPLPASWVGALDLAEALVARGAPFREAHHSVGRLVALLVERGDDLTDADFGDLVSVDDRFREEDLAAIPAATSVARRATRGAGSHAEVERQIVALRRLLT